MLRASVRANLIQPSVFTIFVFRNTMKMKPLFICYPRCSTCQKALKWLQERGIEVEVRDIVQQNPSEAELEEWIDRSGLAVNRFFNTSGLRYKALNLKEKVRTASREELIRVLSTDGTVGVIDRVTAVVLYRITQILSLTALAATVSPVTDSAAI